MREDSLDGPAHDRLALELEEELLPPHTPGQSGCQYDRRDHRILTRSSSRPERLELVRHVAGPLELPPVPALRVGDKSRASSARQPAAEYRRRVGIVGAPQDESAAADPGETVLPFSADADARAIEREDTPLHRCVQVAGRPPRGLPPHARPPEARRPRCGAPRLPPLPPPLPPLPRPPPP